jgi:hypothetical protein
MDVSYYIHKNNENIVGGQQKKYYKKMEKLIKLITITE